MATKLPRLNVTVTSEQHALLLELAALNGGSAAGYLRQMLDQATPLLRATVPALRAASQEMTMTKEAASEAISGMLRAVRDAGVQLQPDLLDAACAPPGAPTVSVSERGHSKRRKRS